MNSEASQTDGSGRRYLLDSNACIAILNGRPAAVGERLRLVGRAGAIITVSAIVAFELWYGVAKSDRVQRNRRAVEALLTGVVEVLAFDEADARAVGDIRATLERAGTPIGPYDLLIAGQALRRGLTLVTANRREFARVPGLLWEDWS